MPASCLAASRRAATRANVGSADVPARVEENDMACQQSLFALTLIAAASPLWASQGQPQTQTGAPAAPPTARYCLRVDPSVGSRMETIRCETRAEWAALDVDVDREWAMWGVRVVTTPPYHG